jgi:flagellar hook-associated protein 1 FlgK
VSDVGMAISRSALEADQTVMATIAENLANAETPRYVREQAELAPVPGGPLGTGSGVAVVGVSQAADAILQANALAASAASSAANALEQTLSAAESAFPEPGQPGIGTALSNFWNAFDQVAADPLSQGPREALVGLAEQLATSLNEASAQLGQVAQTASGQLSDLVARANALLGEVGQLNEVAASSSGGTAAAAVEQRNQVLAELAKALGVTVRPGQADTVQVFLSGVELVEAGTVQTLSLVGTPGSLALAVSGTPARPNVASGEAAGLLQALNQDLPAMQAGLDQVASRLASTVNGQLAAGYVNTDVTGSPNQPPGTTYPGDDSGANFPLFEGTTAATIAVNPALVSDPGLLAASGTPPPQGGSVNDGTNAQAMAELYDAPTGPDQAYRGLVGLVGSEVQGANDQVQTLGAADQAASSAYSGATGVDQNAEMVAMVQTQQAFQAAAKVVNALFSMTQSLLQAT